MNVRTLAPLIAAVIVALAPATLADAAPAAQPTPRIYILNASTGLAQADLANAIPAFQAAVTSDFAPAWNANANLVLAATAADVPPGAITITISDTSDAAGAAGYHYTCPGDVPCAKVFLDGGVNWQVVFTHELFELLADPHIDRATYLAGRNAFHALEVGDPVEAEQFAYTRPGADGTPIVISDFVTERWFDNARHGPYDFSRDARHSFQVLQGGYASVYRNGGWTQIQRIHGVRAAIFRVPSKAR